MTVDEIHCSISDKLQAPDTEDNATDMEDNGFAMVALTRPVSLDSFQLLQHDTMQKKIKICLV